MGLDARIGGQGGRQLGDRGADPGAVAVQRADIEGETNRVHAARPTLP